MDCSQFKEGSETQRFALISQNTEQFGEDKSNISYSSDFRNNMKSEFSQMLQINDNETNQAPLKKESSQLTLPQHKKESQLLEISDHPNQAPLKKESTPQLKIENKPSTQPPARSSSIILIDDEDDNLVKPEKAKSLGRSLSSTICIDVSDEEKENDQYKMKSETARANSSIDNTNWNWSAINNNSHNNSQQSSQGVNNRSFPILLLDSGADDVPSPRLKKKNNNHQKPNAKVNNESPSLLADMKPHPGVTYGYRGMQTRLKEIQLND